MKRQLIICGLLVFLVGCGHETLETSDDRGDEIAVEDETFLAGGFEGQLTEIDDKLARIEIGLDERLTQIESRLRAIELGGGGTPPAQVATRPTPPSTDPASPLADVAPAADGPATETPPAQAADGGDTAMAQASAGNDHPFVGPAQCAPCHLMQFQSWTETTMAKAYVILRPGQRTEAKLKANLDPDKDYTQDETCLPCHVTGYGKPGGFQDEESTPFLAGVSCEMCHGAGGTYLEKGLKKNEQYKKADLVAEGLVAEITISQCQTCHNDRSPFVGQGYVFDFEANKEKGTHQHYPLQFEH